MSSDKVRLIQELLHDRGYDLIEQKTDDAHFGDAQFVYERRGVSVRFVRDRGQWFVEAKAAAWEEWFAPTIWRALLTDSMPPAPLADFAAQSQVLVADLTRIEGALDDPPVALDRLRDWRDRRIEARRTRNVRLRSTQLTYLAEARYLPGRLREPFAGTVADHEVGVSLDIEGSSAEEIRSRLTERLAEVGFDEAYEPTDEGRVLEDLLDALMG